MKPYGPVGASISTGSVLSEPMAGGSLSGLVLPQLLCADRVAETLNVKNRNTNFGDVLSARIRPYHVNGYTRQMGEIVDVKRPSCRRWQWQIGILRPLM